MWSTSERKTTSTPRRAVTTGARFVLPLTPMFVLMIVFICCRSSCLLSVPEFGLLDLWLSLRPPRVVDQRIALVGIDQSLLEAFQEQKERGEIGPAGRSCTCASLDRATVGRALSLLKHAGAQCVGLDLVFDLKCPLHDTRLLEALAQPGQTILLSGTNPTPGAFNFTDVPLKLNTPPVVASPVLYNPHGIIRGVRLMQEEGARRDDPKGLRTLDVRPPLAVASYVALKHHPEELPEVLSSHRVRCFDVEVPVLTSEYVLLLGPLMPTRQERLDKHAMLISWAGRMGTFPMYSLRAVLDASPEQLSQWFRDRVVLLGSIEDRQYAPLGHPAIPARFPFIDQTGYEAMSGLEVHANALDTLLQQRFIQPLPTPVVWLLMAVVSWLTLTAFKQLAAWKALLFMAAEITLLVGIASLAARFDHWVYVFIPTVCLFFSAITGAIWGFSEARRTAEDLMWEKLARDAAMTTVIHDNKQPLAAIGALAQVALMQLSRGKAPTPELFERIQQEVQRALGDIDELLATDANRVIPLTRRDFDLAALARDLASAQSLKSSRHTVEVQAPGEGVMLNADPRYLGRALSNLIDNAIKYWPEGGTVVVEIRREPGQVKIRVLDHGLGIAPEAQSHLFNRFQRAVPAGVDIPGTGIGLYSVKRIAEAHGGTVHLISAPGEGSIFVMTLPLVDQPAEQPSRKIAT